MADDREGRDRGGEDLFEDFDKFFAPIEDVDWPEDTPGGTAGAAASDASDQGRGGHAGTPTDAGGGRDEAIATEEVDLLPEDWAEGMGSEAREVEFPDLQTSDATAVPAAAVEPAQAGTTGPGDAPAVSDPTEGPAAGGPAPKGASRFLGEPTSEMSAEDWQDVGRPAEPAPAGAGAAEPEPYSFMEQFLPDQREGDLPEFGEPHTRGRTQTEVPTSAVPPRTEVPPEMAAEGPDEDSGPLSLEDLRKAPPEYAGLPGPPEGAAAASAEPPGDAGSAPGATTSQTGEGTSAGGGALPVDEEPPPPGGLEMAAEHFAESIRQEGPDADQPGTATAAPVQTFGGGPEAGSSLFGSDPGGGDLLGDFSEPPAGPRTVRVGSEDLGPSWQEPTSMEVGPEEEGPPPGRNIPAALLSGVVLAILGLGSLAIAPAAFAVIAGAVILLAQLELYAALRRHGHQPAAALGLVFGALIVAAAYFRGLTAVLAMAALSVPFTAVWFMAVPPKARKNVLANMSLTLFGILYIPVLASHVVVFASFSRSLTIAVLALAFGYDILAYAGGSIWGEHLLAPTISPGKTREGLVIATFATIVGGALLLPLTDVIPGTLHAVGIAVVAVIFAPLGDLAESLMKRDLGVKDMSSILPGHGGALDRIDSILFVAPAVFYYITVFLQ